jgi:hydrogenase-1 operon protein HyaF
VSINEIPVRVVGAGSQPEEGEQLRFIDMPGDMARYSPPYVEDLDAVRRLDGARAAMQWLRQALRDYQCGSEPLLANLSALDDESRDLVNQVLGEGEVSVTFTDDELSARTQESVLAGVWRTLYFDSDGRIGYDLLEVADAPLAVRASREQDRPIDITPPGSEVGFSNALPILVELESQLANYAETGERHSINLTLLPLSEEEVEFLDERLGRGPVDVLSRAYGKCQVISTATPNVWWVRYYNAMGTLILNSLEVVTIPQVVCAAPEDLRDSAERLDEILAPYWPDVA